MEAATEPRGWPVGCRFHPTEEEAVSHYLMRRVGRRQDDNWIIPDFDLCSCHPSELQFKFPGRVFVSWDSKVREWWFFSQYKAKKVRGSTKVERSTRSGFWKKTGGDVDVMAGNARTVIGTRKILVFHEGKGKDADKTNWVIHEYHLPGNNLDTHVLCRLKLKQDKKANNSTTESGYLAELALNLDQPDDEFNEDVVRARMNSLWDLIHPENRVDDMQNAYHAYAYLPNDFMLNEDVLMNQRARTTDSVHSFVPLEEKKGVVENKFNGSPFASERPMPRPVTVAPRRPMAPASVKCYCKDEEQRFEKVKRETAVINTKPECISLDETAARAKVIGCKERGSASNSTKKTNKENEYAGEKSNSVAASTGTTSESTKTSTNPPLANLVNVLFGIFLLLTITRQVLNF
ncbi:hypothetical protein NL676_038394 [Syzygium grande]|nr:hypothetical protein NL676_038394 [Syzygium grande]